jgi:hypothetical protein
LISWDGLYSLQEKGCQKSIKQWGFDDLFHIERPGYTANNYRQTTDKLMFKRVIFTVR